MRIYLVIAVRNLIQARRRSLFLGGAVSVVTMLLVLLLSLSAGVSHNLIEAATTLSAGHVNVSGFYKSNPSDASPIVTDYKKVMKVIEENTPGLDYVIDRHRGWAKVVSPTGSIQSGLAGIEVENESVLFDSLQLAMESEYIEGGRDEVLGDPLRLAEPKTAMLFESQAERLGVGVGDVVTVRSEAAGGQANTIDLTVVAVARDVGLLSSWTVFTPKSAILELYQLKPSTTGAIQVYLKDIDDADAVMSTLRQALAEEGYRLMDYLPQPFFFKFDIVSGEDWTGQKLDLTSWSDEVSFLVWILTALDSISFTLVAILLAIIAIGILNTMLMSVRERTQEIGTLRAIGMSKREVLFMILLEALILGLVATTLGAMVGSLIAAGVDAAEIRVPVEALRAILLSDVLSLRVEAGRVAMAVFGLTAFTGFAALWPSIRAARMQPVTAIHKVD